MSCPEYNNLIKLLNSSDLKHLISECKSCREKMYPKGRNLEIPEDRTGIKISGVALICKIIDEKLHLVFIKRAEETGPHSGQIAFPGGKLDLLAGDKDTLDTSIRETFEEIGIQLNTENLLFKLSQLYVPPSNFLVDSYVYFIDSKEEYFINKSEVAEIFEIPVSLLFEKCSLQNHEFDTIYGKIVAPCYIWNDVKIWGATAIILNEFLCLYEKSNI